jgi:hypothetical protein
LTLKDRSKRGLRGSRTVSKGLVTISKIGREPDGGLGGTLGRPLTVRKVDGRVRLVLLGGVGPGSIRFCQLKASDMGAYNCLLTASA